jgi:hypothetical protein
LTGGTGGRGEALDLVAVRFGGASDHGKCSRFARAGQTLDTLNAVRRTEYILNDTLLSAVEMGMLIGNSDGLLARQSRLDLVLSLAHAADDLALSLDGFGSGELTGRYALRPLDYLKFTGSQAGIQVAAHLGKCHIAHASAEAVANQCPFIDDCLPFKVFVA